MTYSVRDLAFGQALIDGGYFPSGYRRSNTRPPPPNNLDEIHEKLRQRRPSVTNEDFEHFESSRFLATTKPEIISRILPIIVGREALDFIPSGQGYTFDNLEQLTDNISKPRPDYFSGSNPEEVSPKVREDLKDYIVPSKRDCKPLLPNFFFELSPDGGGATINRKLTQDLAYGARGMHKIQSYAQDQPVFDGNAYAIGGTYHSDSVTLTLYTTHPTRPTDPNGKPEYWTTPIKGFAMTDIETFREGVSAFRNAQDWAKKQRDAFIEAANKRG